MKNNHYKKMLLKMFDEAISISHPKNLMKKYIPNKQPSGKTVIIGAGKASAEMAREFERAWDEKGFNKLEGIIITRYGHKRKCKNIKILEASHPVPDKAGLSATNDIINLIKPLNANDLVIVLISGGGSSLLVSPLGKVTLKEKQNITNQLLRCGATISEINSVRKHLSSVKGGKLASFAYPAKVITLAISDVPGDDFGTIASGPTYPDQTSNKDAIEILSKYNISITKNIEDVLKSDSYETPKKTDEIFENAKFNIIAKPQNALVKASKLAEIKKINTLILSDSIEGESNDVGLVHSAIVKQVIRFGQPAKPPLCILSGGETTVTIKKENGKGGRNTQFLLSLVIALGSIDNVYAIACDTDGIDGSEDNAGAIIYPDTLQRAHNKGLNPKDYLERNDAYTFFKILGDIIETGPTHTNVNDFRAILISND